MRTETPNARQHPLGVSVLILCMPCHRDISTTSSSSCSGQETHKTNQPARMSAGKSVQTRGRVCLSPLPNARAWKVYSSPCTRLVYTGSARLLCCFSLSMYTSHRFCNVPLQYAHNLLHVFYFPAKHCSTSSPSISYYSML